MTAADVFRAAVEHHRSGNAAIAERLYRRVLEKDAEHAESWFALSILALESGRWDAAVSFLSTALQHAPDNPQYLSNLGEAYRRLGRLDEAVSALRRALTVNPTLAEAHFNLGLTLHGQAELFQAIESYRRALVLKPGLGSVEPRLAAALREAGRLTESAECYVRALTKSPGSVSLVLELGNVLYELGRFDEALRCYDRALELAPTSARAHTNVGTVLRDLVRLDEAVARYERAVELEPELAAAHANLGTALADLGRIDEAICCYRRALALKPDYAEAHSNLVYCLSFDPACDARAILDEAQAWGRRHAAQPAERAREYPNDRRSDRRLRIGYVSPDFRRHCQSLFTVPLLSNHSHAAFDVLCYSNVQNPDDITERVRGYADGFRNIVGMSDEAVADMIRNDRVDILVDLTMHMERTRLRVFTLEPAPVQICFLAYPGTTGLDAIDYRVTDPHLDPPDEPEQPYAETCIRLPDTFWCYDPLTSRPDPGPLPALDNGYVTFGCLNNFRKVNEEALKLWASVLSRVPKSKLVLLAPPGRARERVRASFEREGVDSERLELVDLRPRDEYLETYRSLDLCLDTFPYNGHTTSLDAFWMGVPVVTLIGSTVVGRAGLCQARNLDLPELVARTPSEYVETAVRLAGDVTRLSALRAGLRTRMQASPLMDAARFAHNLEEVFRTIWLAWCTGKRSRHPLSASVQ